VKAVVVPADGEAPVAGALTALVKGNKGCVLGSKTVDFVEAIPLTSVSKHDKKALRATYWHDCARGVN
jgi:fatty-acyl-CoA synthase